MPLEGIGTAALIRFASSIFGRRRAARRPTHVRNDELQRAARRSRQMRNDQARARARARAEAAAEAARARAKLEALHRVRLGVGIAGNIATLIDLKLIKAEQARLQRQARAEAPLHGRRPSTVAAPLPEALPQPATGGVPRVAPPPP